jgi:SAM-dependent methyltransferase
MESDERSGYYQHVKTVPLASRVSFSVRRRMFDLFMDTFQPEPTTTVLDVGVTCDTSFAESNYFERFYPYPQNLVCVGTEDGSHLETMYPGLRYQRVRPGDPLPFADAAFDIVFSNAVIEHVGSRAAQQGFLREICRVGKAFYVTTPNRWFPIELHTGLPFLHQLPKPLFRRLIRDTRYRFWSDEANLNLLGARELIELFPDARRPVLQRLRLAGLTSNLVAVGRRA